MKKRINVTARDIAKGMPYNPRSCPIARAARRVFRDAKDLAVMPYGIFVDDLAEGIDIPEKAASFIRTFDSYGVGEPFSFTVEVPA